MGLAAYGHPEQLDAFRDIVRFDSSSNGNGFRLDSTTSRITVRARRCPGPRPIRHRYSAKCFGRNGESPWAVRAPEEPLEERHRNLASSLQARLEEVYLGMLKKLGERTGLKAVCLAGGVAFNCRGKREVFDATPFEQIYVHPAAGDAGLSCIGASVLTVWHQKLAAQPRSFVMDHAYWGPGLLARRFAAAIASNDVRRAVILSATESKELSRRAAAIIADGKNSRLVSGPRRMGPRAPLAIEALSPTRAVREMKEILNRRIKHREVFARLAPSIPRKTLRNI